ncbi:MAG: DNA translocase FtsK, partial [Pseudomonadota bacterium]
MAYQTRERSPLLDQGMQDMIEKRSKELIGALFVALGLFAAMIVGTYSPNDPSWLSATDAPVQNWMGQLGASIAAPVVMIVGKAGWVVAFVALVWGARFILHRGAERALSRLIFLPIAIAVCAIYLSSLVPGGDWSHTFGLGGLFGDTVLGAFLTFLPMSAAAGLKLMSLVLAIACVIILGFVTGFTGAELRETLRFMTLGVLMCIAFLLKLLGMGAHGAVHAAGAMQARQAERRETQRLEAEAIAARRMAAEPPMTQRPDGPVREELIHPAHMPMHEQDVAPELIEEPAPEKERGGLLSRMPSLIKRAEPAPEPEPEMAMPSYEELPQDQRIQSKIADVIKSRVRHNPVVQSERVAPLTKGRGHGPTPMILDTSAPRGPRAEPPLTLGATAQLMPEPELVAEPSIPGAALGFTSARMVTPQEPAPQTQMMQPQMQGGAPAAFDHAPSEQLPQPELVDPRELMHPAHDDVPSFESAPAIDDADMAAFAAPETPLPKTEPARRVVQNAAKKPLQPSTRAKAEAQPRLQFEDSSADFELPPLNLLENPVNVQRHHLSDEALEENARMLESVLDDYGVKGEIVSVRPGPVVTMYELEPAPGLKASRVIGLADDIARSMSALSARVSTVPGRSVIGIELPNENREKVVLREILSSRDFGDGQQKLPLALGKDIGGDAVVANLAKMPHLLIAGTTGSGKSVAINTMILSLLYKLTPDECRLIMIDPKMLELSVYDGIPHLLSPVVTDPKKAVVALKWVVGEMEERYRKMSKMGVRNIDGYNSRVADALSRDEMFSRTVQTGFDDETGEPTFETEEFAPEKMPYIVVIVDEMADLMMVAGKEIEACIQRLAQMARASGIHLIMATQRPSVDVITGTIKANFPTRISFQVT